MRSAADVRPSSTAAGIRKQWTLTEMLKTYKTDTGFLILSLKTYETDTGSLILSLQAYKTYTGSGDHVIIVLALSPNLFFFSSFRDLVDFQLGLWTRA